MKLKELLELCYTYVELDIDVRDTQGYLIKEVYIGQDEWRASDRCHYVGEHEEIITFLNYYESDEPTREKVPGLGINFKVIPKELLNAEVTQYRPSKALPYHTLNDKYSYDSRGYKSGDAVTLNATVVMLI